MDVNLYLQRDPNVKIINQAYNNLNEGKTFEEIEQIKNRGNFLLRQEIDDHTPSCSFCCILMYHIIFTFFFLATAIPFLTEYDMDNYYEIEYTNCLNKTVEISGKSVVGYCITTLNIKKSLSPPIFIYYQLDNFFTNHMNYVKSRSYEQLRGENISTSAAEGNCKDMAYNYEHFKTFVKEDENFDSYIRSYTGEKMNKKLIMDPCGLIAKSMFNDTFSLESSKGKKIEILETEIARKIDVENNYKNSLNYKNTQWLDKENEHFMNWMKMETFPKFLKKWGRIESDISEGRYTLTITKNWGKENWEVKRSFILAKGSTVGKQKFFGYSLMAAGAVGFIMIIIIGLAACSGRQFKPEKMSW